MPLLRSRSESLPKRKNQLQRQIQEHLHEAELANAEGRRDDVSFHLEATFEANGYLIRLDRAVMIAELTRLREAGFHTTPGGKA